ncbi:MAG: cation-transporting P-type ATPase, partial [Oxalobacter sp.]|nr:cation-transporting P-type ATPase [Oxalobacter sp.]
MTDGNFDAHGHSHGCCGHGHEEKSGCRHGKNHAHPHDDHGHDDHGGHDRAHHHHPHSHDDACCCAHSPAMPRQDDVSWPPDYAVLHIMDMDCAVEENDIRRILSGIGGIRHLECSLPRRQLAIDADEKTVSLCLATIQKAGYRAERIRPGMENTAEPADKKRMWRLGTALGIALVVEIMHLL